MSSDRTTLPRLALEIFYENALEIHDLSPLYLQITFLGVCQCEKSPSFPYSSNFWSNIFRFLLEGNNMHCCFRILELSYALHILTAYFERLCGCMQMPLQKYKGIMNIWKFIHYIWTLTSQTNPQRFHKEFNYVYLSVLVRQYVRFANLLWNWHGPSHIGLEYPQLNATQVWFENGRYGRWSLSEWKKGPNTLSHFKRGQWVWHADWNVFERSQIAEFPHPFLLYLQYVRHQPSIAHTTCAHTHTHNRKKQSATWTGRD